MEYVWIKPLSDGEFALPFGAQILETQRYQFKIRDDDGKEMYVSRRDVIRPMHPSCVNTVDDMVNLGDLQEFAILRNLKLRYRKKLIYTYTGNVLIAVNPYEVLPIYGKDIIKKYQNKKLGVLPPHLYAIGDASYQNMREGGRKQCVIINGESGAGKTHSNKLLLTYYAAITGKISQTREQILESNPILEAFGNAKTVRNDNSSRFGKYISINFNSNGDIEQAEIQHFLLEKSRIVKQCKNERNYHIFYMLFAGLASQEKELLGLKDIPFYHYISQGSSEEVDKTQFDIFRKALKALNFSDKDTWNMFELLSAILHLGNIVYHETQKFGVEAVEVLDCRELQLIANFLGTSSHYLKCCLTKKTITTAADKVAKELNKQEAADTRDAFVKALYGNLFQFIVSRINKVVNKKIKNLSGYIGILDVFGFENLEENSFEQLCINLANESLQQFFIRHTFKLEQSLYVEEGITWTNINFSDNKCIIDMISEDSMSIIRIINDESKFPSSTDETLLAKLIQHHGEKESFLKPKFTNMPVFGIIHFAGFVLYDIENFLEKNRDSYSEDFKNLARLSDNSFLRELFSRDFEANQTGDYGKKKMQTSLSKFKSSLDSLMNELNECHPFFVRCIKPNELKKPNVFDQDLCCQQLRYSGVWETSKIRQAGYAIRFSFTEFVGRYRMLKSQMPPITGLTQAELREMSADICQISLHNRLKHQLGYSKIFLKNNEYLTLEKLRGNILTRYVVIIQTAVRRWLCRKRYLAMKRSAIVIQKHWRGKKPREAYLKVKKAITKLQAIINARHVRILYLYHRAKVIRFQARCRGFLVRKNFREKLKQKKQLKNIENPTVAKEVQLRPKMTATSKTLNKLTGFFRNSKPVRLDSYLHGSSRHSATSYNFPEASKLVEDSFGFLYETSTRNSGNKNGI